MKLRSSTTEKNAGKPRLWAREMFQNARAQNLPTDHKTFYTHQITGRKHEPKKSLEGLFNSLEQGVLKPQYMVVKFGNIKTKRVQLNPDNSEYIIGRHQLTDIQLNSKKISQFHAKVFSAGGHLFVEDLGSKTGTYLNQRKLTPGKAVEIDNHSILSLDAFEISFELNDTDLHKVKNNIASAKNKENNDFLLTRLVKDRQLIKSWSIYETELDVIGIIDETASVKTFRLASQNPLFFNYQPGQYITLFVHIYGRVARRSYSIASTPSRPHVIEITVKRIPGGLVSNWLCDNIKIGDQLRIKGPFGRFSCMNYPSRKILMIAAGSGIVPIMSKIRWIADTEAKVDVKLLMSYRQAEDVIFRRELQLIAANHDNIQIALTLTGRKKGKKHPTNLSGRVSANMIMRLAPDIHQRHVYLCGPEGFMSQIQHILLHAGFPENHLHCESFSSAEKLSETKKRKLKQKILENKGSFQVHFEKSGLSIQSDGKNSLLEIAEAFDIPVDNDCRQGSCGVCMARCLEGQVNMSEQADIDMRDKKNGWIYTCCAFPTTNITLDL